MGAAKGECPTPRGTPDAPRASEPEDRGASSKLPPALAGAGVQEDWKADDVPEPTERAGEEGREGVGRRRGGGEGPSGLRDLHQPGGGPPDGPVEREWFGLRSAAPHRREECVKPPLERS